MKLQRLETRLEVKAVNDNGRIEGYGSVFGNVDLGDDIVAAGAFADSLTARKSAGEPFPMLWQHNPSEPIGVWDEFSEDERGLRLAGNVLTDTTRGRDAYAFLKHKAVSGLSIGFQVKEDDFDRDTGIRTIRKADLWEVSVVTFPMNQSARVDGVKFVDAVTGMTEREIERFLRDAGVATRDAKAAVSRLMDLGAQRDAAKVREAAQIEAAVKSLIERLRT